MVLIGTLALSMFPPSSGQAGLTWTVDLIDVGGSVGRHSSLAIASNGTEYVTYLDQSLGVVKLATSTGVGWSVEIVDGPGLFDGDTSLAIDVNGTLHLSYFDVISGRVRYGLRSASGGSWNLSDVDRGLGEGYNQIAIDRFGVAHLVYSLDTGALRYAHRSGASWIVEAVDPRVVLARYESIAVDRDGRPHIAYYGVGNLRYAWKSATGWTVEVVDSRNYVGWFSRLRLDSVGSPHIGYYDSSNGTLNYATRAGVGWSRSVVDASGDAGWDISVAVGRDDVPRMTYYARIPADLRYAVLVNDSWQVQTADDAGVVGWESSLALDPASAPHVTYYDWSHGSLKHAVGSRRFGARTVGAPAVTETTARLRGEVTSLGPFSSANASFEWRGQGETTWRETSPSALSIPGTFEATLAGLAPDTTYEYRAKVVAGGIAEYGGVLAFRTRATPPVDLVPLILSVAAVSIVVAGLGVAAYVWFRRRPSP